MPYLRKRDENSWPKGLDSISHNLPFRMTKWITRCGPLHILSEPIFTAPLLKICRSLKLPQTKRKFFDINWSLYRAERKKFQLFLLDSTTSFLLRGNRMRYQYVRPRHRVSMGQDSAIRRS